MLSWAGALPHCRASLLPRPELVVQTGHRQPVLCIAFSPDGRIMATGGDDTAIRLWDLSSGRRAATLARHQGAIHALAYSPDGGTLRLTLVVFPPDAGHAAPEWIVYTPHGDYDASDGIGRVLRWRMGNTLLPATSYAQTFLRPESTQRAWMDHR